MAATQSLQDVTHLLTPRVFQDATHFVDAQSVATMSHTNNSIYAAVQWFLLSYKEHVLTAFKAGVGPNCQVHVWRTDMLKQIPVEIAGCSCGNNLVLSTNKNSATDEGKTELGNWRNELEPPLFVETDEFATKVNTCCRFIGYSPTAYIMLHGGKTVEPFLLKINELRANHPGFRGNVTRIPLAVVTRARSEYDETKIEALVAAGFDAKFVWLFHNKLSRENMCFRIQNRLRYILRYMRESNSLLS